MTCLATTNTASGFWGTMAHTTDPANAWPLAMAKVAAANPQGFDWMNTSVFSQEVPGYFGNVKRGILHGPGYNYTNMDLLKNFYLNSARNLYVQLRLEAYNVFNHPNFASPDGNFSDGPNNFGVINSVKQPGINGDPQPGRTVQLAGKFYF